MDAIVEGPNFEFVTETHEVRMTCISHVTCPLPRLPVRQSAATTSYLHPSLAQQEVLVPFLSSCADDCVV